jgi:hypothetical protein
MSPEAIQYTGGCRCGAVRFRSMAPPLLTRVCWCRDCQYFAAGNATVNVCFAKSEFHAEGTLSDFASVADSGNAMHRRFCPQCGTPLFSEAEARPEFIFVRAGSLDNPEWVQPAATIWAASAPSWACIDEDLPQHDGQPPPPTPLPVR